MNHVSFLRRWLLAIVAVCLFQISYAQAPQINLEKYWKYRERLKNAVVPGNCMGCSLPASRGRDGASELAWDDETIELGYYIGMLATEYRLLQVNGQNTATAAKELYYALETFNRLDKMAEYYWQREYSGNTGYVPHASDLNGFFIRDDVDTGFFHQVYNGNLVENHLNNSLVPAPDGKRAKKASSGFSENIYEKLSDSGQQLGPTEESLDQATQLLIGFALVAKYVPASDHYLGTFFSDGEISFAQEAKNCANRIVTWMQINNWNIINPVTGHCAWGVFWENSSPNCSDGGANVLGFSYGFAMANSQIQSGFNAAAATLYFGTHYGADPVVAASVSAWNVFMTSPPPISPWEDFKVLTLAAIGNPWGSTSTQATIRSRCEKEYVQGHSVMATHLPMLHAMLFGTPCLMPGSVYECMINSAPCDGNNAYNLNYEWSNAGGRVLGGPNGYVVYSSELNGLDYLLYFNMYNLHAPAYLGSSYQYIRPEDLVVSNIVKQSYTEYDEKNFAAENTITAQNSYTIKNDNDFNQALPYRNANVRFIAGNTVNLMPGFTVLAGANFNASIDPSLKAISCEGENNSQVCSVCSSGGDEARPFPEINDKLYKVYSFVPNELLIVTPFTIFKVREEGGVGQNMFGVREDNPGLFCPTQYGVVGGGDVLDDGLYYLVGYQRFDNPLVTIPRHDITDVEYLGGFTFIAFADGRILKVQGTGGLGENMFGIDEHSNGTFTATSGGTSYYVGSHKFKNGIVDLTSVSGNLFLSFNKGFEIGIFIGQNGKMLKVAGAGGSGQNLFGINETNGTSNTFSAVTSGTSYYVGDADFKGWISNVSFIDGFLFVSTRNFPGFGKVLKLIRQDGSGNNMFGISEYSSSSSFAFENAGYPYYYGDHRFSNSYVTNMTKIGGEMFVCFDDGRMMKVSGTAGGGHYLFNVDPAGYGFQVHNSAYTSFLLGSQNFGNGHGVTAIEYLGGSTVFGFRNGKVLKVNSTGGTGAYMFNLDETSTGFVTHNSSFATHMQGYANFRTSVSSLVPINGKTFLGLGSGFVLKFEGTAGGGSNMFAVDHIPASVGTGLTSETYESICGYYYLKGVQNFPAICAGARIEPEAVNNEVSPDPGISIYPNPNNGAFTISFSDDPMMAYNVIVYDLIGNEIAAVNNARGLQQIVDLSGHANGVYLVRIIRGEKSTMSRIVKQ
ncbi:MAG: hypothetical protein FD123_56 [Bacteroidetes bacterium]|nr:MAG: hypothetical protein FD123_56 [Bacteroidota bacterium]